MGPQVQPKCFRHAQHMRNNWELRKRGYLIRFGHTEALLLKKRTLNGHFSRPAETDPYEETKTSSVERWWGFHILRSLEMEYVLRSEVNIWDWGSFCPVPLRNLISNNLRQSSIKTHVARHLQSPHFKMFYIRSGLHSSSRDFLNT